MTALIITQAPGLVLQITPPVGPVLTLQAAPIVQLSLTTAGVQGPVGPAGDGVQADPGDFTLIFENQLI